MERLPRGYRVRPASLEDVDALLAFVNLCSREIRGEDALTREQLLSQLTSPGFDPAADTRLVISLQGEIVGSAYVVDFLPPHVQAESGGSVHPEHLGKGIGSALLSWIEERAQEAVAKAPPGTRVSLHQGADDRDKGAQGFLERHGYRAVRHFWRMVIEMDVPPPAPIWPKGIQVRAFDPEKDLRAAILAVRDAFRDHWGFVEIPLEKAMERQRHVMATDPDFDPTLRFLALEGAEIVGVCYGYPKTGADVSMGYIPTVGVRRPWRRRGLALALLHHTFGEFYRRGIRKVALHVDSTSLTGATRLYERAGMHPDEVGHAYEKELRPGVELSTQELRT